VTESGFVSSLGVRRVAVLQLSALCMDTGTTRTASLRASMNWFDTESPFSRPTFEDTGFRTEPEETLHRSMPFSVMSICCSTLRRRTFQGSLDFCSGTAWEAILS